MCVCVISAGGNTKRQRYQAVQLPVEASSRRVFVMIARNMQAKSGGRRAPIGLGFLSIVYSLTPLRENPELGHLRRICDGSSQEKLLRLV